MYAKNKQIQKWGVRSRRGVAMVQTAVFGSLVGMGAFALAVDTGLHYNARSELQRAADAASLAAAAKLCLGCGGLESARDEAVFFAAANKVAGLPAYVDPDADILFGHAEWTGTEYVFQPNVPPFDAVRVQIRRDGSHPNKPKVGMLFARAIFEGGASMGASAVAMMVPRDLSIVVDLSSSMNDDSMFPSPDADTNLEDVWLSLPCVKGNAGVGNGEDPPPPGQPNNENDQAGTGPGSPANQRGNPSPGASPHGGGGCGGPRWGWMTGFGDEIVPGEYDPTTDIGLYYIPRGQTTTDPDVLENLNEAGYSAEERAALLNGAHDANWTYYQNRVKILTGLAGWRSKKSGGKYNGGPGNRDDYVDNNEVYQEVEYPFDFGDWNDFVAYAASADTQMAQTMPELRYRYGIKTVTSFLLEHQNRNPWTPELADAPEMPLHAVKEGVQRMVDVLADEEMHDHLSLEVFSSSGRHEHDLSVPAAGQTLALALQSVADQMFSMQAGYYDGGYNTNTAEGLARAVEELTSDRNRPHAARTILLVTNGPPDYAPEGQTPTEYTLAYAAAAAEQGIRIYTVGIGSNVDADLLQEIADRTGGQYLFVDDAMDPDTGRPQYETELPAVFEALAGASRPVRLIR